MGTGMGDPGSGDAAIRSDRRIRATDPLDLQR
jgi:hypothetical protein